MPKTFKVSIKCEHLSPEYCLKHNCEIVKEFCLATSISPKLLRGSKQEQIGGGSEVQLEKFYVTQKDAASPTEVLCQGSRCVKTTIVRLFRLLDNSLGKHKVSSPISIFSQSVKPGDLKVIVVPEVAFDEVVALVKKFNDEEAKELAELEEEIKAKPKSTPQRNPYLDDDD